MKKLDIAALRHPTSTEPDFDSYEKNSYAIIVSLADAVENVRIAQERFVKMQMEQFRLL